MIPLYALAQAMQERGHSVRMAAEEHQRSACTALGIPLEPLPSAQAQRADADGGGSLHHWRARLRATLDPGQMEAELQALLPLVRSADLVIGNQLAYAGALACRITGRRWVFSVASPLAVPSFRDAPYWPYLHPWQRRAHKLGMSQRGFLLIARWATRLMMQSQVRLYRRMGASLPGHPRFEAMYSNELNLVMTSPELAPHQSDWPSNPLTTGFAWFDPPFLGGLDQQQAIEAFAMAGDPPIVFAPGGSTRVDPGAFFQQSVAAARSLGRRAIIVAAKKFHAQFEPHPDLLVTGYFPYARLFKLASVVVHSGGIGALGWAARYGVPSLLVPSEWDQFDNARRAQRVGLGRVMDIAAYTGPNIVAAITALENDTGVQAGLQRLSAILAQEDGVRLASDAVEALLRRPGLHAAMGPEPGAANAHAPTKAVGAPQ